MRTITTLYIPSDHDVVVQRNIEVKVVRPGTFQAFKEQLRFQAYGLANSTTDAIISAPPTSNLLTNTKAGPGYGR